MTKIVPQLHEILAVESDAEKTASENLSAIKDQFTSKGHLFVGVEKRLEMYDEKDKYMEKGFKEKQEVTLTVTDVLNDVSSHLIRHIDILAQKERTNQNAREDVTLPNGKTIIKDIPATMLLGLERWIKRWKTLYLAIPTRQSGLQWNPDKSIGKNIFMLAEPEKKHKTKNRTFHKVVYEATKEHAAQIHEWTEDVPVGQYITNHWSGMISQAQKTDLIERIDMLLSAVKKARMRANTQEVAKIEIGKKLINFIHEDI